MKLLFGKDGLALFRLSVPPPFGFVFTIISSSSSGIISFSNDDKPDGSYRFPIVKYSLLLFEIFEFVDESDLFEQYCSLVSLCKPSVVAVSVANELWSRDDDNCLSESLLSFEFSLLLAEPDPQQHNDIF